ncbi:transferase [Caulobacter sp. CCUG 60055]|nr:transferase [Caulobacter sp. CCUG 60055]
MGAPILVVGAGGYGRCVADAAILAGYEVLAFVDREPAPGLELFGKPVVDERAVLDGRFSDAAVVVAVGDNCLRERIVTRFSEARNCLFPSIIHPRAVVSSSAAIGPGTVVLGGSVVSASASIGQHCSLYPNSVTEHEADLGDFVTLAPAAALGGKVSLGARTFVGLGAVVRHNISLGEDCVVGAGATVLSDVPARQIVVGTPAKLLRDRKVGEPYL